MSDESPGLRASQELLDLIFTATEQAIQTLQSGRALRPVLVADISGDRYFRQFSAGPLLDALQEARRAADDLMVGADRYAIVSDGIMAIDGRRSDAILLEAGEVGQPTAAEVAQRYRRTLLLRKVHLVGNVSFLGELPNRLATPRPVRTPKGPESVVPVVRLKIKAKNVAAEPVDHATPTPAAKSAGNGTSRPAAKAKPAASRTTRPGKSARKGGGKNKKRR